MNNCQSGWFLALALLTYIAASQSGYTSDPYHDSSEMTQHRHYRAYSDHEHKHTASNRNGQDSNNVREAMEEDFPDYPYDDIRRSLEGNQLLKQYFEEVVEIGNRGGIPDELEGTESLCKVQTVKILYPKRLLNVQNKEVIVVNDDKNYRQAIEYTKCINDGQQCTVPFESFGYTSLCVQRYDSKRLMVYENSTKKVVFDQFKVPSCCACMVKKV